jgi:hypothetical protein
MRMLPAFAFDTERRGARRVPARAGARLARAPVCILRASHEDPDAPVARRTPRGDRPDFTHLVEQFGPAVVNVTAVAELTVPPSPRNS